MKRRAIIAVVGSLGIPAAASAQFVTGGTPIVQIPELWLAALASFAALVVGVLVLVTYALFRIRRSPSGERQGPVERANAGFAYFAVPEPHKAAFADAMQGFAEYAKLKGYNVAIAIDSTVRGKVGIKFEISDSGITVSTERAKSDFHEYVEKVLESDDLADMPIITDPAE